MKMQKILVGVLFALGLTGSAFAAEVKNDVKENNITLVGQIVEFESGDIYLVKDDAGNLTRVHLGKHSGRMLNRTKFVIEGRMLEDEKGPFLKMSHMDYHDPDPFAEYFDALNNHDKNNMSGGLKFEQIRDKAFDHENPVSDNKVYYENNVKKLSAEQLAEYQEVEVKNFETLAEGSKIVFKGRAINTVVDREVMHFWDAKGASVNVRMNGAYCPLGQRCFIYGTLEKQGKLPVVNLEYMNSLELPAEAYEK